MTTVRLPTEIEAKLTIFAEKRHKTKSEIIKEALTNLFYKEEIEKDSFELGEDYFGKYGSGDGTLSVSYKQKLKDKIHAKTDTN